MFQSIKSMSLSFEICKSYNLFLRNGIITFIPPKNWNHHKGKSFIIKYLINNPPYSTLFYNGENGTGTSGIVRVKNFQHSEKGKHDSFK